MNIQIKLSKIPTLPNYKKILSGNVFRLVSKLISKDIVDRTKSGLDVNLQPFIPYTLKYSKKKRKTKVDLYDTGKMLNDIGYYSKDGYGLILIKTSRSKRIAQYNLNRVNYQRKFFGLSTKDRLKLHSKIIKILRKVK